MPHATMKLIPGVDTTKTPALNEAAFSSSQLIRFQPDRNGMGLIQKLGGWVNWAPGINISSQINELHAWEDLNGQQRLAIGAQNELSYITSPSQTYTNITPELNAANVSLTTAVSQSVTFTTSNGITVSSLWGIGTAVYFTSTSGNVIANTVYWIFSASAGVITLSATPWGGAQAVFATGVTSGANTMSVAPFAMVANSPYVYITDTALGVQTGVSVGSDGSGNVLVTATTTPVSTTQIYFTGSITGSSIAANTPYYVLPVSSNTFNLSLTSGGTAIVNSATSATNLTLYNPNQIQTGFNINIQTPISIQTILLSGVYSVIGALSGNQFFSVYAIQANASPASASVGVATSLANGPLLPQFSTNSGTTTVTVTEYNQPYINGQTASFLYPTTSNGVTIYGNYIATLDATNPSYRYTISSSSPATASASFYMNNGNAHIVYYYNIPSLYGASGYGSGEYGGYVGYPGSPAATQLSTITSVASQTVTIAQPASPAVITVSGNAPPNGTALTFTVSSGGSLPTGLQLNTIYYVVNSSLSTTYNVSMTQNGSPISVTAGGSGTFTANYTDYAYITLSTTNSNVALNQLVTGSAISLNNKGLYPYITSGSGTVWYLSITPGGISGNTTTSSFTASFFTASVGYGLGIKTSYPSGIPLSGVSDWVINNFGEILIANPENGPIYYWSPTNNTADAFLLANAPLLNHGIFIAMPARQVVAYGSTVTGIQDPLLIRWSDAADATTWIASANNQAGSYRIPEGSSIVGGIQGPQQALIWTNISVWAMQYVGAPNVYGFNKIADGMGLIGKKAVGILGGNVYWMSPEKFCMLSSTGPQPLACPVWDQIYQNINTNLYSLIRCATNSTFGEVTWYYPTTGSSYNNAYVKYNAYTQQWDYGTLARTAWVDQSVLGTPIGSDNKGYIYQHEVGYDNDINPMVCSFQTGYIQLNEADNLVFVDQIWPDFKWQTADGATNPIQLYMTFYGADYPDGPQTAYGPYYMDQNVQYISCRIRARLLSISVTTVDQRGTASLNTFFRIGAIRYRYQLDGKF